MAGNKAAFQKALNQGHSAAWDQDWEKAAQAYSTALEEFPTHPLALTSLGLALYEMQDFDGSLSCYQRAAEVSPEDPIPQEKIARIFERTGRLNEAITASLLAAEMHLKAHSVDKAIDNWQRVLSIQPENTNVRTRLAAVYERIGRREEAVAEYITVAGVHQRTNKQAQAIQALETAVRVMPDNHEVRLALNMVRANHLLPQPTHPRGITGPLRMTHVIEIESQGESVSSGGPDPVAETRQKAMRELASLLFEQSEENSAVPARGRGLSALTRGVSELVGDSSDRNRITLHLGQSIDSLTQNDNHQAVIELEHALHLGLRQPAAYFILGQLLADENPEKALKYLQQSIKNPGYSLGSHLVCAHVYENNQQWKEAASSYLQALALADSKVVRAEQVDDLIAQYDALIDSQSMVEDPAVLQATCRAISAQLMHSGWRTYLEKARQQLPPTADGISPIPVAEIVMETRGGQVVETMAHVRQLAAKGMVRSALEEALYALQFAPTYMPLHILVGELLLQEGRQNEAIRKFLVVVEMYSVRGEIARAERMLKRISQVQPSDFQVRQRLIDLLVAQNKIEEALNEFSSLANLFYNLADLDKSRQTYLDALKIAQNSEANRTWGVNLLLRVADIDMQRLNLRQALRIYEQIRTIQPENQTTRAQIVSLNIRLGQEAAALKELDGYLQILESQGLRKQAIDFINGLLVDYSTILDLRRRLADLYIRNGEVHEAVIQLDTVADAHLNANRNMEAVNMLETIIALNPPNVQEYRKALETLRRDMLRQ